MAGSAVGPKGGILPTTIAAGAAIIANRILKRGADKDHAVLATAAAQPIGVSLDNQDNVDSAVPMAHRDGETVYVESGAAVALDARVTSDATGRGVTAATGNPIVGYCREPVTAAGQLMTVELRIGTNAP